MIIMAKRESKKFPEKFYIFRKGDRFFPAIKFLFFYISVCGKDIYSSYENACIAYKTRYNNIPRFVSKEKVNDINN